MQYYLGIDGGGTKTKVIIIDQNKNILFENTTGPSSIDTVNIEVTFNHIYLGIKPFMEKNKITFNGIFGGLGGIVFDNDKKIVENTLKKLDGVTHHTKIKIDNDMYNALYSGLLFDEGICLICGTGMVAFGKDTYHNIHKSGGWSYKEGELGSGYHLGMEAIRYMIRAYDGRLPKDAFAIEVAKKLNLDEVQDIVPLLDDLHLNRTRVASFAPLVTKYANLNHPYALKIIELATDELSLAIKAVYHKLTLHQPKIVIVGSLGNVDGIFKDLLHQKIKNIDPKIEILSPLVDPALAAAIAAQKL